MNVGIGGVLAQYLQAASGPLAINDTGALTANGGVGSVTINLPTTNIAPGTYRLIGYSAAIGGTNGFSAFTLGTQPTVSGSRGGSAVLTNDPQELDLVVTGDFPIWTGAFSSEWSTNTIASPKNWQLARAIAPRPIS